MKEGSGQKIYLKDYQPPEFLVEHTDLHFLFEGDVVKVRNRMKIRKNPKNPGQDLFLNGDSSLKLKSLLLNGEEPKDHQLREDGLYISNVPDSFDLEIKTQLRPQENTSLEGLYQSSDIFVTQNEPEGFRKISYFLDRPDVLSTFSTSIEASRSELPVLLSNGNRVSREERADGKQVITWHDPFPKPCYLFALVAGRLDKIEDQFVTRSGRNVQLEIYCAPGKTHLCYHAMQSLKKAMAWDEERYGLEYDLDLYMIVAIDDFNGGAMENKGLNVFNSKLILADESTATDDDFEAIEAVIAHEYFHNWTGNRVTLRDWFQLSLKEGLTVYRDQEYTADQTSRAVKRIDDVKLLRARQFAEDAGPSAHPVRPDAAMSVENFFTTTIYEKGAELIRMIEQFVGRDGFRKGMDLYFKRHDGDAVTCDDFVKAMEDANGYDLTQFRNWYAYAGTPRVRVHSEYDESEKTFRMRFEQSCPETPGQKEKPAFHIPLALGVIDKDGMPVASADDLKILELKDKEQVVELSNISTKPYLSLLRSFSAPIIVESNESREDLLVLAQKDPDTFSKWEALQRLYIKEFEQLQKSYNENSKLSVSEDFLGLFGTYIEDISKDDPAYASQLLSLPHKFYVAQCLGTLDPKAHHQARVAIGEAIFVKWSDAIGSKYAALQGQQLKSKEFEAVALRRLKNQLLQLLCASPDFHHLAEEQFQKSETMTDQIGALTAVCSQSKSPVRDRMLFEFYTKWENESLVLNKWFSLQAMIPSEDQLQTVKDLTQHPAFEIKNPNKVHSLLNYFAQENHLAFHREDGESYSFYLSKIAEIDKLNPSVAARISQALQVKTLLPETQAAILTKSIKDLLAEHKFSNNTLELLQKMATS